MSRSTLHPPKIAFEIPSYREGSRVRPVKIGRAVRIPSDELEAFLQGLKEARDA